LFLEKNFIISSESISFGQRNIEGHARLLLCLSFDPGTNRRKQSSSGWCNFAATLASRCRFFYVFLSRPVPKHLIALSRSPRCPLPQQSVPSPSAASPPIALIPKSPPGPVLPKESAVPHSMPLATASSRKSSIRPKKKWSTIPNSRPDAALKFVDISEHNGV
jgi:hypothetical protein